MLPDDVASEQDEMEQSGVASTPDEGSREGGYPLCYADTSEDSIISSGDFANEARGFQVPDTDECAQEAKQLPDCRPSPSTPPNKRI